MKFQFKIQGYQTEAVEDTVNVFRGQPKRALKKYIPNGTDSGRKCPDCGAETVIYQERCLICTTCGNSRCG